MTSEILPSEEEKGCERPGKNREVARGPFFFLGAPFRIPFSGVGGLSPMLVRALRVSMPRRRRDGLSLKMGRSFG